MRFPMNGGSEEEMMDADAGEPPPMTTETSRATNATTTFTTLVVDKADATRDFLTSARQLIDQGKPSQALQAVVMATRTQGGDQAVTQILNRTRELYRRRIQETSTMDHLASLFAECAIAEAQPLEPGPPSTNFHCTNQSVGPDAHGASILAETGRAQIMLDAFADGSSFICLQCGGLVSIHRRDEHCAYWCSNM